MKLAFSVAVYDKETERLALEYDVSAEEYDLRKAFNVSPDQYFGDGYPIVTQQHRDAVSAWVPEWPDPRRYACFLEVHQG